MEHKFAPESISFLLGFICKAYRTFTNDALTELGLYAGQEVFLHSLWDQDGLTQSQLVEQMCVQHATLSKMVDRMEKSGLVAHQNDAEDSRVTRIFLTEQGKNLEKPVRAIWDQLEAHLVAGLNIEERILLRRLLLQVSDNLGQDR